MRTLTGAWRWAALAGVGVCIAAAAAGVALAAGGGSATTYTGCLSSTGAISAVQKGSNPIGNTCPTGKTAIKLSSGDITGVTAGTGLAGGATSGNATLALAPSYSLPQACSNGESAQATGQSTWQCGHSTDTPISFDAIPAGQTAAVNSGHLDLALACSGAGHVGELEVDNVASTTGTFNIVYGVANTSTTTDIGFNVNPETTLLGATTAGSLATLVFSDGQGGIVTGTVTWFYDTGTNTCQFHGDLRSDA